MNVCLFAALVGLLQLVDAQGFAKKVIYAVNCGGPVHRDHLGIDYKADDLGDGIASDFGTHLRFDNVPPQDAPLYQTERYSSGDITYKVKLPKESADYVLVLKFSEIFDVMINEHVVISQLDIFEASGGQGWAYDRVLPFKGDHDNPKVNALYVAKNVDASEIPVPMTRYQFMQTREKLHEEEEDEDFSFEGADEPLGADDSVASGPPVEDPYAREDQGFMTYAPIILGVIVILIPTVYFLVKM